MMKVSVVIPTYGEPNFLEKAVQSVLNQTETALEVIVVDDNNPNTNARKKTEQLLERLKEQDNRIIYVKHDRNRNGSAARNTGIKRATGKYIAFLDSDDEYKPSRLEKCYNIMEKAAFSIAGVYTGCEFRRSGKVYHTHTKVQRGNHLIETLACTFMFGTGSNLFLRRAVVEKLDGFDESFWRHQDYEFLVRLFEKYSLEAISEVLVVKNNENLNLPNVSKIIAIKQQYLKKFQDIIDAQNLENRNYIFHSQYIEIAETAMNCKEYAISKEFYGKAKGYGEISAREAFRRFAFGVRNIIWR